MKRKVKKATKATKAKAKKVIKKTTKTTKRSKKVMQNGNGTVPVNIDQLMKMFKAAPNKECAAAIAMLAPHLFARPEFPKLMESLVVPGKLAFFFDAKNAIVVHRVKSDLRTIGRKYKRPALRKFKDYVIPAEFVK